MADLTIVQGTHRSFDSDPRNRRGCRRACAHVGFGLFASGLFFAQPAAAASNFIQLYLAAQGGCADTATSPLSFVFAGSNLQAPFGKPAEDWSDDDLAVLKTAIAFCQAASAQAGNPYTLQEVKQESEEVLARVPQIVAQARARAEAQAQQLAARRQLATTRIDKATKAREQTRASAEVEAAHLEHEADVAEAEARDAQERLDQRIQRATRAREEAKAKAAAIAGIERQANEEVAMLPQARPAAPGELSELVPDENTKRGREVLDPPTLTTMVETSVCRTIEAVTKPQPPAFIEKKREGAPSVSGECRILAKGTQATVQAAAAGNAGVLCVAFAGQPGCLWVAKAAFGSEGH